MRLFKESTWHTRIFWIVALSVGILTAFLSLYPYIWFDQHRSTAEVKND